MLISFAMYLFFACFFLVCLFLTACFWRNKDAYKTGCGFLSAMSSYKKSKEGYSSLQTHRYGNSYAIWDHTVLAATRQR